MKSNALEATRTPASSEHGLEDEVLRRLAQAISGVRYGSVEVVIQDSRVVQIERKEKFRFDRNVRS